MKRTTDIHLELKRENRRRVFYSILKEGSISGPALESGLGLSRPTVRQNLDELLALGYIYESGAVGNTGGRKAKAYSVASGSRAAIGLDLTEHCISVVKVDLCGNIRYEKRIWRDFSSGDDYMAALGKAVEETAAACDGKEEPDGQKEQILGVGISVPGLVSADGMQIFCEEFPGLKGLKVKDLERYIPYPCRLYNHSDSGGYAEVSNRDDLNDAFYLSLGNYVAGTLLIDGKVYGKKRMNGAGAGHMMIETGGRRCHCGQEGCLGTYCSTDALIGDFEGSLDDFFKELRAGSEACKALWADYMEYLSVAVRNIRMLINCPVILGGGIGAYIEDYVEEFNEMVADKSPFGDDEECAKACKVKKEASALGAALSFIHEFWENI